MPRVRFGIMQMGRVRDLREGLRSIRDLASTLGKVDLAALPEGWIEGTLGDDDERALLEVGASTAASLGGTLVMGGYRVARGERSLVVSHAV
ncbi:MAG: hypothetical protein ACP5NG_04560, partial [Conexivisphaera sp.]